jgi:hypothetical protein
VVGSRVVGWEVGVCVGVEVVGTRIVGSEEVGVRVVGLVVVGARVVS